MTAPKLRGYQVEQILETRKVMKQARRIIYQAPTGSGKTVVTAHMIRTAAEQGLTSWFLVHRRELLEQTSKKLWESDVHHGMIAARRPATADQVQVATVQTLVKRVKHMKPPHLLVIDEAHHTAAASYRQIVEACPNSWIIGLTATPCRTDGRGLDDLFDAIVLGPPVRWLIDEGYLSRFKVIAPKPGPDLSHVHKRAGDYAKDELEAVVVQEGVIAGNVEHYLKHLAPRSCLVYCVSRAHARAVEAAFRAAGVDARYCAGDTEDSERNGIVDRFRRGALRVIVSVDLFSEGLDVPGLQSVQLLRPTASLTLHLQQVGRALRVEEGKECAIILDQVGNTGTIRPDGVYVRKHGLPDEDREWSLQGRPKKDTDKGPALKVCPECFAVVQASAQRCPDCEHVFRANGRRGRPEVEGELLELSVDHINGKIEQAMREARERQRRGFKLRQAQTLEDFVRLAIEWGHKSSWAAIRYAIRHRGGGSMATREEYRDAAALETSIRAANITRAMGDW